MSTDKLFEEASLDDVVNAIAAINGEEPTPARAKPDEDCSLVEIQPDGNGRRVVTVQRGDDILLDNPDRIDWATLNDNTDETYEVFLRNTAEDPDVTASPTDTSLPLWTRTGSDGSHSQTTTYFTDAAQEYINDNPEIFIAELLDEKSTMSKRDIPGDMRVGPFDNKQHLSLIQSYLEQHAPDLTRRGDDLTEAAIAYRESIEDVMPRNQFFVDQFKSDTSKTWRAGIASAAHDMLSWQDTNADNLSAKAFTSAVKAETYRDEFSDGDPSVMKHFLAGSNKWLLFGAAKDYFANASNVLDGYRSTRDAVSSEDMSTDVKQVNGASAVEYPHKHQGSRQVLRNLLRHHWVSNEYAGNPRSGKAVSYPNSDPSLSIHSFKSGMSHLNHVLQREPRYLRAIGTDTVEREVGRLGNSYNRQELQQAALNAITDGVPTEKGREQVFRELRKDRPLIGPKKSSQEPHETYLVSNIGTQLMANATIRAHSDKHSIADPLRQPYEP